jgi:hypothetical protein
MSYRIFVSHATADSRIANEVRMAINNAFEGNIELYLAMRELSGGDEWREEIKKNLKKCDAIICIITPESINKPWLFIEWSAFWLADKKFYPMVNEINFSDLIQPMQDRQITTITDETSVRVFFRALAADSSTETIPYKHVKFFVDSVRDAIALQKRESSERSFAKYRDGLKDLPKNDLDKRAIADFFYQNGEFDIFIKIINEIRDDSIKSTIATQLIDSGDIENALSIPPSITAAERLGMIAVSLIAQGYTDWRKLQTLIENISSKNQTEVRKIAIFLAKQGQEDTELFKRIVGIMTNMAELRKVATYLVENTRLDSGALDNLIGIIGEKNRAELRKVGVELIQNCLQHTNQFWSVINLLSNENQKEAIKLMLELIAHDKKLAANLLKKGIITNEEERIKFERIINAK